MKFTILTLFPELIEPFFQESIMARSVENNLVSYEVINFRDFATDRHRTCDDTPYGGGAGMVVKPEPLGEALKSVGGEKKRVVFASPGGKPLTQAYSHELAQEEDLVFICGRYEGIDQRIIDMYVDDEISIGDYVISSGEVSTLVIIDSVYRLLEGVINAESLLEESFVDGLLEYPHYTRPATYCGRTVPDVLLSGHHANIDAWRHEKRIEKTFRNRPELLADTPYYQKAVEKYSELKPNVSKGTERDGCDKGD